MGALDKTFQDALAAFNDSRIADAERYFREVIKHQPSHIAALNFLTVVLMRLERYAEAEKYIAKAVALNGHSDASFYNYGLVLKRLDKPTQALEQFEKALRLNANSPETWNNRGTVFNDLRQFDRAISDFDRAILLNPNYADALCNKGKSLTCLRRYVDALAQFDRALTLKPVFPEAWAGRGNALHNLKRHDEAAAAYGETLKGSPQIPFAKGMLLHQKMLCCDWKGIDGLIAEVESDINSGKPAVSPFCWQGIARSQLSLKRCAEIYNDKTAPANPRFTATPFANHKKIRIGYVSGELRDQATSHLIVGLLEQHDRTRFEIYGFDNGWDDRSEVRKRVVAALAKIVDISRLDDGAAANAIFENEIDILVNLNGYFGDERTAVFAQRPSPVQVNYLGFPGTLGASYMDYIIADPSVIPDDHIEYYAEKVVYLPHCYQANDNIRRISERAVTRAECGLPEDGFVFCCFNNGYKILPATFDAWMRILGQVDGSVLWLMQDGAAAANLRREAGTRGIDPQRVVFAKQLPQAEHLARHSLADLFLDTLPYNAHTTASDSLWAGVPVLTQIGSTFAGRVAASMLGAIGLPELITATPQAYEALAVTLATQPGQLAAIKARLANNRLTMPLFDTPRFARHIEAAYAAMVERCRAELSPDQIHVPL